MLAASTAFWQLTWPATPSPPLAHHDFPGRLRPDDRFEFK
jgi:hypothetical protein